MLFHFYDRFLSSEGSFLRVGHLETTQNFFWICYSFRRQSNQIFTMPIIDLKASLFVKGEVEGDRNVTFTSRSGSECIYSFCSLFGLSGRKQIPNSSTFEGVDLLTWRGNSSSHNFLFAHLPSKPEELNHFTFPPHLLSFSLQPNKVIHHLVL